MTINNPAYKTWLDSVVNPYESITVLEKSEVSDVDLSDISEALEEYVRLFKAEIASPAEILTLSRAYPTEEKYSLAVIDKELDQNEPVVIGGPASVEVVDREGHLITLAAMKRAFERFMANFRTRNAMVLHSDVQVGWALPAYISKTGKIYKSGVTGDHLFFITELRDDTKIAKKVLEQIDTGKMKSYSIAGSATSVEAVQKSSGMVMQVNDMELAEVTICEQGVNQKAKFELMKSDADRPTSSCVDGSCLIKSDVHTHSETELFVNGDGIIDTVGSFNNWVQKEVVMQKKSLEQLDNHLEKGKEVYMPPTKNVQFTERPIRDPRPSDYERVGSSETRQNTSHRGLRAGGSRKPFNWGARQPQPDKHKNKNRETIRRTELLEMQKSPLEQLDDHLEKGIGDIARGAGKAVGAAVEGAKNVGSALKEGYKTPKVNDEGIITNLSPREAARRFKPVPMTERLAAHREKIRVSAAKKQSRGKAGEDPNVTIRDKDAAKVGKGFKEYMANRAKENPATESPSGRINYNFRTGKDYNVENMQKSHLEGCGCASCIQRTGDDDTARPATDRNGRPTLGHTGHGNAVAIIISRMQRKSKGNPDTRENELGDIIGGDNPKKGRAAYKEQQAKGEARETQRTDRARDIYMSGGGIRGAEEYGPHAEAEARGGSLTRSRRSARAARQESDTYMGTPNARRASVAAAQAKKQAKAATEKARFRGDGVYRAADKLAGWQEGLKYEGMQKAVYEYLNKAYKVPSKEELKAAGDKRQADALAAAKEKHGEDFTPAETVRRPYRGSAPRPQQTGDERKAAAQDLWRKNNQGKEDPASFANMQKAVYEYLHKNNIEKGALGAIGKVVGGAAKVGAKVAGGAMGVAEGLLVPGESGKSVLGNVTRVAGEAAGESKSNTPRMPGMEINMEKQAPEWTTPQTETPLSKFIDHNKRDQD